MIGVSVDGVGLIDRARFGRQCWGVYECMSVWGGGGGFSKPMRERKGE